MKILNKILSFVFIVTLLLLSNLYIFKLVNSSENIRKNVEKMQEIVDCLNNLPVPKLIYKKENFLEDFLFENEKYCCILSLSAEPLWQF